MKDKNLLLVYALISVVSWISAFLLPGFPWAILIAIAPLFAIYDYHKKNQSPFVRFGIWTVVILVLVYGILSGFMTEWANLPMSINYGILISMAFFAYWLTDTYARNRLGLFTVVIFFAGLEYIGLLFVPEYAYMLLGSSFSAFPELQQWNGGTGLTGVSIWILSANIGMYNALFRDAAVFKGIFRWRTLLLTAILVIIPALISVWFYNGSTVVDPAYVKEAFEDIWDRDYMASAGEIAGRTCAWISVFIVLYGLVQRKVLK